MNTNEARAKRKIRIRKKISGTPARPRLVVYRSNLHIYAQLVDDAAGNTLASTSTLVLSKDGEGLRSNKAGAARVGQEIARLAREKDIVQVVLTETATFITGASRLWPTARVKPAWNFKGADGDGAERSRFC